MTTAADTKGGIETVPSTSRRSDAEREALMADPGFGRVHTDHMVAIRWSVEQGWHGAKLTAYEPLQLDPSAMVLHYGQAIFEGLKAYRQPDGGVAVFRPEENAHRFNRSAARLAMPELPVELFMDAVDALVDADRDWVPTAEGQSLYLRPFMIATEAQVGMRPAHEYLFLLIAFPVTPFFSGEIKPVTVWLSDEYVRAAQGGTGEAKCAGNYAGSLLAQRQAAEKGCDQVVWLDAVERRWVEEMGGMNLFFVSDGGTRLMTPALTGTLLPGVVRDSLLQLAPELGLTVEEGRISVDDWRKGAEDGSISEVFACGTAAVIAPVGHAKSSSGEWTMGDGSSGEVTLRLRSALLDLQYGRAADPHGWMRRVGS
ncbi:MAG: branched-chain amino acid aminotransferase [Frankiales bacterium]|uniref:branched-chain amino acid aminotransferase n=1 Tax=Cryobacterium sp. TaxID=1926290 RepID=UPI00260B764B|nr:branched-chain amino acid aminotransferase [Cryobacterium sp.]MCU1445818.1 branched-chain amino acid aminotransferase [Cryobacterium sp.]MCW2680740.1 branched-chain amino acid aminotransferase [Frankiales bacterium]